MTVSGKTRVCGILACPVEHSFSPIIHNCLAEQAGVDLVYVPFRVEPENLKEAVEGLYALHVLGANVTVPHKQAVIPFLQEIDETAAAIGAVNTLVRVEGGYKGYNTDAAGLSLALKENGAEIAKRTCILIGAGGAARAAAFVLAGEGAEKIICLNRSLSHARKLMSEVNSAFPKTSVSALPLSSWREISESGCLAVQATNVGMSPDTGSTPVGDPEFFKKVTFAMDVIYNPSKTRFLTLCEEAGAKTVNGLTMLLYQGLAAFRLWNPGVSLSEESLLPVREEIQAFLEEEK